MITLIPYTESDAGRWDALVGSSKNGTFLFYRGFMDYHRSRFTDCSLLFEKKGNIVGCFPANYFEEEKAVYSHQGLTYGGLILDRRMGYDEVAEMFDLLCGYYKAKYGAERLIYKPVPYIYNRYPSEEAMYCLFKKGARLVARGLSSTIDLSDRLKLKGSRSYCVLKGKKAGLAVVETNSSADISSYWQLLSDCLRSGHGVSPVHSIDEMVLLTERFPKNISLYICKSSDGRLLAGCWLFKCGEVLHTQYLASSDEGKQTGALDLVISEILENHSSGYRYLDFGVSTEEGGKVLNNGLLFQKEGFGGRGVCYDVWEIALRSN